MESLGTVQEKNNDVIIDALVQSLQSDVGYVREKAVDSLLHIAVDSYSMSSKQDSGLSQKVKCLLKNSRVQELYEQSFSE